MAASLTLIIVGVLLLAGGEWPAVYAIVCVGAGAVAWHAADKSRRARLVSEAEQSPSPRLAAARQGLALLAAVVEIAAVLAAGGFAFDDAQRGLFNGFTFVALAGALAAGLGLLFLAAQLMALRARLNEQALSWLAPLLRTLQ